MYKQINHNWQDLVLPVRCYEFNINFLSVWRFSWFTVVKRHIIWEGRLKNVTLFYSMQSTKLLQLCCLINMQLVQKNDVWESHFGSGGREKTDKIGNTRSLRTHGVSERAQISHPLFFQLYYSTDRGKILQPYASFWTIQDFQCVIRARITNARTFCIYDVDMLTILLLFLRFTKSRIAKNTERTKTIGIFSRSELSSEAGRKRVAKSVLVHLRHAYVKNTCFRFCLFFSRPREPKRLFHTSFFLPIACLLSNMVVITLLTALNKIQWHSLAAPPTWCDVSLQGITGTAKYLKKINIKFITPNGQN